MTLQLEQPPRGYTTALEQVSLFIWLNKLRNLANGWQNILDTVVTDHGQLAGLSDDDHTQYLLVDGSRSMTGGLEIESNDDPLLTLKTSDTTNPTMDFVTTNTSHTISIFLDESETDDMLVIEGQTGAVNTELMIKSQTNKDPVLTFYNGSYESQILYNSTENKLELYIANTLIQDWEIPSGLLLEQIVSIGEDIVSGGEDVVS